MKTKVILTVTVVRVGRAGHKTTLFERSISEENNFPSHLAQQELFNVAHAVIHPPRTPDDSEKD
jgi:hypothetical protein